MIKTLRLRNFKAFQDTDDIELKPITVLAGPNSGGKSSILQSLLLMKQTLETTVPEIALNLEGRFLQFSRFSELVFGKPPLRSCEVGYGIRLETGIPIEVIPDYYPNLAIPEDADELPLESDLEFFFRYKEVKEGERRVVLDRFNMRSMVQSIPGPEFSITSLGKRYKVEMKGVDLPEPYQGREIGLVFFDHFLPLFLKPKPATEGETSPLLQLDPIFWHPLRALEAELESHLRYLGPLREEPRRAYLHSGSPLPEIGQRGENAAQLLWLEKDENVEYLPSLVEEPRELTLQEAVSSVFQHLGIPQPINVRTEKSIVYQILFGIKDSKGKRKQVTIADVGFGVSQLLPVIVMGLRAPRSSLLLFEQPEIHLHPRLQANLADFFLTLALSDKRILVETHSDHFINRLRLRIAEDPTNELRDKVSILFVRPPHDGQGAIIEPLRVDRYGVIENWPPDFLPESADEAEAIFRAGLEKRRGQ
jgi:predicted ATPase